MGLAGLIEQARVAKVDLQHMARTTTGTGITSMQLETACRDGLLIPYRKQEPEAFKTALELLQTDQGGLVFAPIIGYHEQVGELDFSSMYPSIMTRFNISPETVNCRCCRDDPTAQVPEIGHHTCRHRKGLVPRTLAPLLDKRRAVQTAPGRGDTAGGEGHTRSTANGAQVAARRLVRLFGIQECPVRSDRSPRVRDRLQPRYSAEGERDCRVSRLPHAARDCGFALAHQTRRGQGRLRQTCAGDHRSDGALDRRGRALSLDWVSSVTGQPAHAGAESIRGPVRSWRHENPWHRNPSQ